MEAEALAARLKLKTRCALHEFYDLHDGLTLWTLVRPKVKKIVGRLDIY